MAVTVKSLAREFLGASVDLDGQAPAPILAA